MGLPSLQRCVCVLFLAGWAAAFPIPAAGQTEQAAPPAEPATPSATPSTMPSAMGEWLEAEPLGLRFRPPTGAFARSETLDGVFRYEVVDSDPEPRWWLRFQTLDNSTPGLTARDQMDAYLTTLTRNDKEFSIRHDEALRLPGSTGEGRLLLIEAPVGDGSTGITGWLLIPTGAERFLACSIAMPPATFHGMLPPLRDAFSAMEIIPLDRIEAAKRDRMLEGSRMLSFPHDRLRGAVREEPLLYRIYRPANDEGQVVELGWMTVRAIEGRRGEVDPSRDPKSYRGDDHDLGLLIILDAKSLISGDGRNVIDTQTRAWMEWDRHSEIWSTRSTQRQGAASRTTGQMGVRSPARPGQPRPRLEVINSIAERQTRDQSDWVVPPNYLSQAELMVLGKLLPRTDPGPVTFSSYAFDPRTSGLPQRTDLWRRNEEGTWTLETKIAGAAQPLVQTFDAEGERIRRVDHDAAGPIITERIDVETLTSLWRRKGLPID